ncbi:hypothetical protein MVEN_01964200 [Mycena venus]|uniref:F-box domain-containing protein n=1 Tax=Mycena venus TaxID=2733690 RepID=A0A8H6XFE3_9AGAR|nr:hypothetical protein MVEN_01964200 [Mycena venus]
MSFVDSVSPFAEKLGTNYVPSEQEIKAIRDLLADPTEELARIKAEIDEMDAVIGQLKAKHASLKTVIDAHRALISPIRHTPEDVLREIFVACLPTTHNALIDPSEAPILLGGICRHWRAVAHSTPMLWSSIHIPIISIDDENPAFEGTVEVASKLEKFVEQWLKRSATCPLAVSVSGIYRIDSDGHPIHQLLDVSQRLRHLALEGEVTALLPLLRLGPDSLPLLQSIRVHSRGPVSFNADPDATNAFKIPSLAEVSLSILSVDPLSLPLKWSKLTRLTLQCYPSWTQNGQLEGGLDGVGALEVLRKCPNLLRCELRLTKRLDEDDTGLASNTSLITLPHMDTLILRGSLFHLPNWIPHLAVPKLRCLTVGEVYTNRLSTSPTPSLPYMKAEIDPDRFTASSLLELLESFPMISHLRLSSDAYSSDTIVVDDAFLESLSPPHNLCPALTHFTAGGRGVEFSDAAALAFVKARMVMPTPLQQFEVEFLTRLMQIDIMPELQSFSSSGLQATVKYRDSRWKFDPREALLEQSFWFDQ